MAPSGPILEPPRPGEHGEGGRLLQRWLDPRALGMVAAPGEASPGLSYKGVQMGRHGRTILVTVALLLGLSLATSSASAATTITLRTHAGAITTQKVSGAGKLTLVAGGHTITCAATSLSGYGGLAANGTSLVTDELIYKGWQLNTCTGSWPGGTVVEAEMFTQYPQITFAPNGTGSLGCSSDCSHQTLIVSFASSRCEIEFGSLATKFKPGTALTPKAVKVTFSDKVTPSNSSGPCPATFTIKGSYAFATESEPVLSEAV